MIPALLIALTLCAAPEAGPAGTTTVQPGEKLRDVARRVLGDAKAETELRALNGGTAKVKRGDTLRIPGPERALAVSAIQAARNAIATADPTRRKEATNQVGAAETHLRAARYADAARTADQAWRALADATGEPTRFAVAVDEAGSTRVQSRSGSPVQVRAQGKQAVVYEGQSVSVAKGAAPSAADFPLTAPNSSAPNDGARVSPEAPVGLAWGKVEGATSYEVEVAGPRSVTLRADEPRTHVGPLPPGQYRWTVRAVSAAGTRSDASAPRRLEVVDDPLLLEVGKTRWK